MAKKKELIDPPKIYLMQKQGDKFTTDICYPYKKTVELHRGCQIGDLVKWEQINGEKFEGVLQDWDNNTAIIKLKNSEILKAVTS